MTYRPWKLEEIEYMRTNRALGAGVLARHLNRTEKSIIHKAIREKIHIGDNSEFKPRLGWKKEEDQILLENRDLPLKEVQKLLPEKTVPSISHRRAKLGIANPNRTGSPLSKILRRQEKFKEGSKNEA